MKRSTLPVHHSIESLGLVRAERGDIRVEPLQTRLNPKVPFPHKHDFYQIVLITEGSGWHQVDFKKYEVEPAHCYVIKPGQVHEWKLTAKTKGFVIEFTSESLPRSSGDRQDLKSELRDLPDLLIVGSELKKFATLSELMAEEVANPKFGFHLALQSYLKILLLGFIRQSWRQSKREKEAESIVEKFRELIDRHFQKEHSVEFYSERLGLSSKALTMRMSRAVGKSARQLIQERIVTESKRLLAYSEASVNEISDALGYADPNYFVRFFREHVGLTPLKFRRKDISKIAGSDV